MTVYNDQVEDYIWYTLYMQGNVNIAGLVFDDLLTESFDFIDTIYTVNVELVTSEFDLSESLAPEHHCFIEDGFSMSEVFGFPSRIKQMAINVIHQSIVSPVHLCHMHVDIVHGVDTYWEEIGDNVHFPTESDDTVKLAFFYFPWVYETFDLDFEMAEGTPGVWKGVFSEVSDLINMRHELDALWYFNNLSDEKLFIYEKPALGWNHAVEDGFVITDNVQRYLGFKLIEYLFFNIENVDVHWIGNNYLWDNLFIYDKGDGVRGFNEQAFESFLIEDNISAPLFIEKLMEEMNLSGELPETIGKTTLTVEETLEVSGSIN